MAEVGRYATVVIDPPWPSSGYPKGGENDPACDRCRGNRAQKDCPCVLSNGHHVDFAYPLMSVHELRALPVSSVLESDALVFLWTINKFVRDAFDLLEAWKLKYMFTMAWHKPHGPKPVGYPIYNLEHILAVSYTHLRAHETPEHLVCRLLLEKKKS